MVRGIRDMEQALGSGEKVIQESESELRAYAVRALQATRHIPQGEELVEGVNFDILRPGKNRPGASPLRIADVIGRRAARAIPAGDGIQLDDFRDAS